MTRGLPANRHEHKRSNNCKQLGHAFTAGNTPVDSCCSSAEPRQSEPTRLRQTLRLSNNKKERKDREIQCHTEQHARALRVYRHISKESVPWSAGIIAKLWQNLSGCGTHARDRFKHNHTQNKNDNQRSTSQQPHAVITCLPAANTPYLLVFMVPRPSAEPSPLLNTGRTHQHDEQTSRTGE